MQYSSDQPYQYKLKTTFKQKKWKLYLNGYRMSIFTRKLKTSWKAFEGRSEWYDSQFSKSFCSVTNSVKESLLRCKDWKILRIIGHLNVNSIGNKFKMIADIISNFNIFLVSELKLNSSFTNSQFKINVTKFLDKIRTGTVRVFYYM